MESCLDMEDDLDAFQLPIENALNAFLSDVHIGAGASESSRQSSRFPIYADPIHTATCSLNVPNDKASNQSSFHQDRDGDLDIPRKGRKLPPIRLVLTLSHAMATPLVNVGQQLWRGSLLLMDWLIHNGKALHGQNILELGGGLGAASIVGAHFGAHMLCTDIGLTTLDLCKLNIDRNQDWITGSVRVCSLDWGHIHNILDQAESTQRNSFSLCLDDIDQLKQCSIIIAADGKIQAAVKSSQI
eukprot:gene4056-6475_t